MPAHLSYAQSELRPFLKGLIPKLLSTFLKKLHYLCGQMHNY